MEYVKNKGEGKKKDWEGSLENWSERMRKKENRNGE